MFHCQFLAVPCRIDCLRSTCLSTHLVAETLGGNDGDLIADTLVGLEVEGELWVVSPIELRWLVAFTESRRKKDALNDDLGGLLDGLSTNATHDCG